MKVPTNDVANCYFGMQQIKSTQLIKCILC